MHPSTRQRESVLVDDRELIHRCLPIPGRTAPIGGDVTQCQPDQFGGRLVAGEVAAGLDDLAPLGEIAEATGTHRTALSKIANAPGYNTVTDNVDKLCVCFDCEVDALMQRVRDLEG